MIELTNVTHHYGVRPVLRDVTMRVAAGEVAALMGPNGTGKSTLLAVAAGVLTPVRGYAIINGMRRRSSPEVELNIRQRVVYLPAEPWLPRYRSGREWMLAVGRVYGVDDNRLMEHGQRLLEVFDLAKQADTDMTSYSTGQRKKIALCAALITEAPVMLLDEPFAGGLDPSGILALKRILQHRAQQDRYTTLMATPVPELVEEIADKVAVLHEGKLAAFDTIAALRQRTGVEGSLDEVYEHLVNPNIGQNIDRYFREVQS